MFIPKEDRPTDWIEELYSASNKNGDGIPWANMDIHPDFQEWLQNNKLNGIGKTALVIGCGMGDDAIGLETVGFDVTAFDVSKAAIKYCKARFPHSKVDFQIANLFDANSQWIQQFDFVLEIFTIQALPPKYENDVIRKISSYVALSGQLLVIALVSEDKRQFEFGPPWVLTSNHIDTFVSFGLQTTGKLTMKQAQNGNFTYVTLFQKEDPYNTDSKSIEDVLI